MSLVYQLKKSVLQNDRSYTTRIVSGQVQGDGPAQTMSV